MPRKKHKPEEIVAKLRQVDVLLSRPPPALVNSGSPRGPSDCPGSRT